MLSAVLLQQGNINDYSTITDAQGKNAPEFHSGPESGLPRN